MGPKPKLTKEERKALALERKLEKKRLAKEKKLQLKRDHLAREVKYGQITIERYEKGWKKLLTSITIPRMREDLQYAWNNFERAIDSKDFTISLLMDEIRDAEEQYMMNLRNHVENIDKLIELFRNQLEELKEDNENELQKLYKRTQEDADFNFQSSHENEQYLKTMVFGLEMERKKYEKTVRAEYFSKLDEEKSKNNNLIQKLRAELERTYELLWEKTVDKIDDYMNKTQQKRKLHDEIKAQDDRVQNILEHQIRKIQQLTTTLKKLRDRYAELEKMEGQKVANLEVEKTFFHDAFKQLKDKLELDIKLDQVQRTCMTVEYIVTLENLENLVKKGEKILHLAQVCRKLETIEEKVLPYPAFVGATTEEVNIPEYKPQMEKFWQKVANADTLRYAINEEREFLKSQNRELKRKLHQFCQCAQCPADETPIVNRRTATIPKTEGSDVMSKYKKQGSTLTLLSLNM